jgi:anti-anti-sigma factor
MSSGLSYQNRPLGVCVNEIHIDMGQPYRSSKTEGVVMPAIGTIRVFRADPASVEESVRHGRATLTARTLRPGLTVVSAEGDIDATNGRDLGRFVERHTGTATRLIVDLSGVTFFGSQGFTALHYISVGCARADVEWQLVAGVEGSRILSICDPQGELPLASSVDAARSRLDRVSRLRNPVPFAG